MAEALISPGVFLRENDLSQITAGPITVGASLIGPSVVGRPNIPTLVTSYSQYKAKFGTTFVSGGNTHEYLTSQAAYNYFQQGGTSLLVTRVVSGSYTPATASVANTLGTAFVLETISVGTVMNNDQGATTAVNGLLPSGSSNNIRWQISQADSGSGYFTLLIRAGNDYTANQSVLETWTNLSLDPNQNNYIAYVIGDQTETVRYDESGQAYLQITGSYPNASNYVRVKEVVTPTPNYLNPQGRAYAQYTASVPVNGSGSANGSFGTATGPLYGVYNLGAAGAPLNLFEQIPTVNSVSTSPATNIQGVFAADYDTAINLLANKDAYVYNSIYVPGLSSQNAANQISALLATVSNRGDAIAVVDMVGYGQQITTVNIAAQSYDNSYGATYWPWVQTRSNETGRLHFVPASTIIPAVYEYNDKVSAEWFAPAGLNRGGLPTVIQPEVRLTVNQRNSLYTAKVNPIAVFPGQGTVVYGQKTLQARASALDRVNVRRLLIALKGYIGQIAQTLVFEQNTAVTRNKFLSQVNPYLDYVQQRQGLYAFRVVMDDTNNTPDVIDRNLLVGAIYLQPTRTAEFIQLDFNVLPTGVTFGA